MRLKDFYVVHVRLPVFHETCMVAGYHPAIVVAPNHRSHWTIMRLKKTVFNKRDSNSTSQNDDHISYNSD